MKSAENGGISEPVANSSRSSSPIAKSDPLKVANTDSSSSGHSMAASAARKRLDFGAVVERPAADQEMRNAARFEGLDVGAGGVFVVADETAETEGRCGALGLVPGAHVRSVEARLPLMAAPPRQG